MNAAWCFFLLLIWSLYLQKHDGNWDFFPWFIHISLSLSGVLPVAVNTVAAAANPGPSFTVTALTPATAEQPATAVSHLTAKHQHMTSTTSEGKWRKMGGGVRGTDEMQMRNR